MSHGRSSFSIAINDFHKARQRAALERIYGRITGRSVELLSFEEVSQQLRTTSQVEKGLKVIPVDAIVGSVGRYTDFSRTFLPRLAADAQRWASVATAAEHISMLPPIEAYQIGDAYFVLDGNHRVSIAKQQGIAFIDAFVTEVRTMVPFSPDDEPDELILKSEHAAFLAHTRIDQLRPGAELTVSVPGQYAHLENHIEVHRYFREVQDEIELSDSAAVCAWYDDAYLPMVEAIREQGILRYFPGRTETDFYVWLATHQSALQNELGWEITPETAVAKLAAQFEDRAKPRIARLSRKVLDIVVPDQWKRPSRKGPWSQEKAMARYSDRLFAEVLVPLANQADDWSAVDQALIIAGRERAQLLGLHVMDDPAKQQSPEMQRLQQAFRQRCQAANVTGNLALQVGQVVEKLKERMVLADLLVVSRSFSDDGTQVEGLGPALRELIRSCARPILVVPGPVSALKRVLLAYDGQSKANEALFVATYLAEQWPVELILVTIQESNRSRAQAVGHARKYLAMHELEATFIERQGPVTETIDQVAVEFQADIVVIGGHSDGRLGRRSLGSTAQHLLADCQRPVLICP